MDKEVHISGTCHYSRGVLFAVLRSLYISKLTSCGGKKDVKIEKTVSHGDYISLYYRHDCYCPGRGRFAS